MSLLEKLNSLKESKKTIYWGNIFLVWSALEVIRILLVFKLTEYNLVSPLIPENLNCEIFSHYVDAGLVVSAGFITTLIFKIYNKKAFTLISGALTLIVFYFYSSIKCKTTNIHLSIMHF